MSRRNGEGEQQDPNTLSKESSKSREIAKKEIIIMTNNEHTSSVPRSPPRPDPALSRLKNLVRTWELRSRTLNLKEDNI
jgi:hypothetical protein